MAETILAADLSRGDVFYMPQRYQPTAKRVAQIRVIRSVESYVQVDYQDLSFGIAGGISNIRHDLEVVRVRERSPEELADVISGIAPGDHLVIFRVEDTIWA